MTETICEWVLVLILIASFFYQTKQEFEKDDKSKGFQGFLIVVMIGIIFNGLLLGAGAFDSLDFWNH